MSATLPTTRMEAIALMTKSGGYNALSPEQQEAVQKNWKHNPTDQKPAGPAKPTETEIILKNLDKEITLAIERRFSEESVMDHMIKTGAPKSPAFIRAYVRSKYAEHEKREGLKTKTSKTEIEDIPDEVIAKLDEEFKDEQAEQKRVDKLNKVCKDFPATDAGNGERFATRWKEVTRYCHPRRVWYIWTGKLWSEDRGREVYRLARRTARAMYNEVPLLFEDPKRQTLAKWAIQSEGKKRLEDMLFMATIDENIGTAPEIFDAGSNEHDLFNVQNGTLDLIDPVTFREHKREDMLTKIAGTHYDPAAVCPLWDAHLRLIFGGNEDLVGAFQEHIGYSMLSGNPLNLFEIWHGASGSNGKSVTLATIREVFGGYCTPTSADTYMENKVDSASARPELVALRGARLVTAVETEHAKRLAEGTIKNMTGGDPITARGLFRDQETFTPEFVPILATNHRPVIRGMDGGIWRRIRLWPFSVEISNDEKIPHYDRMLISEAPGILNWMIAGLRRYYASGCRLSEPDELMANTNEYRAQQDVLKSFIPEMCEVNANERCLRTELHAAYLAWCVKYSEDILLPKVFYEALREHNFNEFRGHQGRYFLGIRLKTPAELLDYQKGLDAGGVGYQTSL